MWHQECNNILIAAALYGHRFDVLLKHFKDRVDKDELQAYLELLLKEDKAQKFKYKGHFYWRATVNITK